MDGLSETLHDAAAIVSSMSMRPVLVVDDDEDDSFILAKRIKSLFGDKTQVITFKNGAQMLSYLKEGAYDAASQEKKPWLALLDINMPKVDGIEVLRQLRGHEAMDNMVIFIVSGAQNMLDVGNACNYGADGFLAKPLSTMEFLEILHEKVMEKAKAARPG